MPSRVPIRGVAHRLGEPAAERRRSRGDDALGLAPHLPGQQRMSRLPGVTVRPRRAAARRGGRRLGRPRRGVALRRSLAGRRRRPPTGRPRLRRRAPVARRRSQVPVDPFGRASHWQRRTRPAVRPGSASPAGWSAGRGRVPRDRRPRSSSRGHRQVGLRVAAGAQLPVQDGAHLAVLTHDGVVAALEHQRRPGEGGDPVPLGLALPTASARRCRRAPTRPRCSRPPSCALSSREPSGGRRRTHRCSAASLTRGRFDLPPVMGSAESGSRTSRPRSRSHCSIILRSSASAIAAVVMTPGGPLQNDHGLLREVALH